MIDYKINQIFKLAPFDLTRGQTRRILLVQTDWEMGLASFANDLEDSGHEVYKIVLNASDYFYKLKKIKTLTYRSTLENFEVWLESVIDEKEIDTLIVYNPYRPFNKVACTVAGKKGLGLVQFDQGLLRPLHVSVFYGADFPFQEIQDLWENEELRGDWQAPTVPHPELSVSTARKNFFFALSVLFALIFSFRFPHYKDQQKMSLRKHLLAVLLNGYRFLLRSGEAFKYVPKLVGPWSGKFFLVPLQLEHDVQIQINSPYSKVDEMIDEVADSFEAYAAPEDRLIFKIHPLDRGYKTFKKKFATIQERIGKDRVFLVDRVPLSVLLDRAKGVITVNSTVGLTALRHLTPVKTLGKAFYDVKGLTFSGKLDEFWKNHQRPKSEDVRQFINMLEMTVQGRGTLSRKCYLNAGHAGILWPTQVGKTFRLEYFLHPQAESFDSTGIKERVPARGISIQQAS